ncbi:MAG: hypothetical protein JSR86_00910 [Proteobacteria bacterium]|nr:hypothetical protein [Pseudomonadota bacterium]
MRFRSIGAALLALWAATAAAQPSGETSAASPAAKPQGRPSGMAVYRVCKADMKLYCPHMSAGSAKQKQCMKENFEKLGPDCQAILKRLEPQAAK